VLGAQPFYDAYRDLVTERGPDLGPIPWRAAMAYADRKRLRPDLAQALWVVVRTVDAAEREWWREDLKRQTTEGGGGA
jgi:hypothetical protein